MTAETTAATATDTTNAETATTTTATATDSTQSTDATGNTAETETTNDTATETTKDGDGQSDDKTEGGAPEAYEFTMPEGVTLDQALVDKATPIFKELNLTNDQATKLVGLYAEQLQALGEGSAEKAEQWRTERNAQETAQRSGEWLEATKADKEIGGTNFDTVRTRVVEAIGAVGTPEARTWFNESGMGNNPELIRLVHRLIDYTPQDRGERPAGGGGGGGGDLASRMYPDMQK